MAQSFYAIYENGVFRPLSPVAFSEGEIATFEFNVVEESLASDLLRKYRNEARISDDDAKSSSA